MSKKEIEEQRKKEQEVAAAQVPRLFYIRYDPFIIEQTVCLLFTKQILAV